MRLYEFAPTRSIRVRWVLQELGVADFVRAYTLDWANEVGLLAGLDGLRAWMAQMYARPAPPRIAVALASVAR